MTSSFLQVREASISWPRRTCLHLLILTTSLRFSPLLSTSFHFSPSTSFHRLVSKSSPQPTIASFLCKAIKACFRKGISSPRVAFHCIPRPKLLIIAWPKMTQVDLLPSKGLFVTIDDDNWKCLQIAVAPIFLKFLEAFNRWWVEVYLVGRENQNRPFFLIESLQNLKTHTLSSGSSLFPADLRF